MNGITITVANFASMPVGVIIVWGIMKLLDTNLVMTTRTKVLVQLGISFVYALVAALLFMDGSMKELSQQGVILFLSVALAQVFGYETFTKLLGTKGDGKPLMLRRKTSADKQSNISTRAPMTPDMYMNPTAGNKSFLPKDSLSATKDKQENEEG
jgi:hypothetical protein